MSTISAIDHLECIIDGDTLVPGMGYVLPTGVGLTQFVNISGTSPVSTPSYKDHPISLYPQVYSSSTGKMLVPDPGTIQWFVGNPEVSANAILTTPGTASVKGSFNSVFAVGSTTVNGQTFPALRVIGNLYGNLCQFGDITIYARASYNGIQVTSHANLKVQQSVGEIYAVLIDSVNEDGASDTVIDNDSELLQLTAHLQVNGGDVTTSSSWKWFHADNSGALVEVTHVPGVTEISGNKNQKLTIYDAAVDGTDEYFARITHNGATHTAGITLYDTHDPYYINLGRSQNSNVVRPTDTLEYNPSVIRRSDGTVQSGWNFQYRAYTMAGSPVGSTVTGSKYTVSGATVKDNGGLTIRISATKS